MEVAAPMPLVRCPDCGHSVSTSATVCPQCGRPGPFDGGGASGATTDSGVTAGTTSSAEHQATGWSLRLNLTTISAAAAVVLTVWDYFYQDAQAKAAGYLGVQPSLTTNVIDLAVYFVIAYVVGWIIRAIYRAINPPRP